jgi:hypothetical protein
MVDGSFSDIIVKGVGEEVEAGAEAADGGATEGVGTVAPLATFFGAGVLPLPLLPGAFFLPLPIVLYFVILALCMTIVGSVMDDFLLACVMVMSKVAETVERK